MNGKLGRAILLSSILLIASFLGFSQDPGKSRVKAAQAWQGVAPAKTSRAPITFTEKVVPFIQRSDGRGRYDSAMPTLIEDVETQ